MCSWRSLQDIKATQAQWKRDLGNEHHNDMNLVFTNPYGGHLTGSAVYKALKRVLQGLGLDEAHFHSLRHSFFVYAYESGYSMKEIQESMGHSHYSTTMDIYGSLSHHIKRESAERLGAFMQSARNEKA